MELQESRKNFIADNSFTSHNGYRQMKDLGNEDYFLQSHRSATNGFQIDEGEDRQSVQSLNIDDMKKARQLLTTVRLRRKSRRLENHANKSGDKLTKNDISTESTNADNEYIEEVGMPSMRQRTKSLTEKLFYARQQQSTTKMAKEYRYYKL